MASDNSDGVGCSRSGTNSQRTESRISWKSLKSLHPGVMTNWSVFQYWGGQVQPQGEVGHPWAGVSFSCVSLWHFFDVYIDNTIIHSPQCLSKKCLVKRWVMDECNIKAKYTARTAAPCKVWEVGHSLCFETPGRRASRKRNEMTVLCVFCVPGHGAAGALWWANKKGSSKSKGS